MNNHSSDSCDQDVIDYYQEQQISSGRLQAIMSETQSSTRPRFYGMAVAASVFLLALAGVTHYNVLNSERTQTVMREAALNHVSKMRMDISATSIGELQSGLAELPFEIKLPESGLFERLSLLGGRYCTMSGNLAAHIKMTDPETSEKYSLFLTPYSGNLKAMQSEGAEISGVDVRLWQENNVVYALVATSEHSI